MVSNVVSIGIAIARGEKTLKNIYNLKLAIILFGALFFLPTHSIGHRLLVAIFIVIWNCNHCTLHMNGLIGRTQFFQMKNDNRCLDDAINIYFHIYIQPFEQTNQFGWYVKRLCLTEHSWERTLRTWISGEKKNNLKIAISYRFNRHKALMWVHQPH